MPAISTIIGAIGLGIAAGGAVMQQDAARKNAHQQQEFQEQALAEQQHQEALRSQQMNLDSMRRKRSALRDAMVARATTESVATNQGAQFGSAVPGAYGGIEGTSGNSILATNQNAQLGGQMFASNAHLSGIYRNAASASSSYQSDSAMFSGMSSLGGMMMNNAQTIGKVGSWFGKFA